jgi:hypothetical protein
VPRGQPGGSLWPYSRLSRPGKNYSYREKYIFLLDPQKVSVCLKFKNMYKYNSLHFRSKLFTIIRPKEVLCNKYIYIYIYIFDLALIGLKLQLISVTGFHSSLVFDDVV